MARTIKYKATRYEGVFRRNGIIYIRYPVPGKENQVWESTKQTRALLGKERRDQRLTEIAEGRYFPNRKFESATFADLVEYWWNNHGKETTSRWEYRYPKILEYFKNYLARDITSDAIEEFLNSLTQSKWVKVEVPPVYDQKKKRTSWTKELAKLDTPLSNSSRNQYRTILHSIFAFNIRKKRYDINPVESVDTASEDNGRETLMMPEDFHRFRQKCQEIGDWELDCYAILSTTTALRAGSILPRKWTDIHNLDGDAPYIDVAVTKNGEPKPTPLSDEAIAALKRLPSWEKDEYLFPAKSNPRFPGENKDGKFKRPYVWSFGKRFRRVCRLIGLRNGEPGELGPRIHDWRHFSASVLLAAGVPDNTIAKHTGHKSKALERYKHLFPQLRQQTVQIIDAVVRLPKIKNPNRVAAKDAARRKK